MFPSIAVGWRHSDGGITDKANPSRRSGLGMGRRLVAGDHRCSRARRRLIDSAPREWRYHAGADGETAASRPGTPRRRQAATSMRLRAMSSIDRLKEVKRGSGAMCRCGKPARITARGQTLCYECFDEDLGHLVDPVAYAARHMRERIRRLDRIRRASIQRSLNEI